MRSLVAIAIFSMMTSLALAASGSPDLAGSDLSPSPGGAVATIRQQGNGNTAKIVQQSGTALPSPANGTTPGVALLIQTGTLNQAALLSKGLNNRIDLQQSGAANRTAVSQLGNNNSAALSQGGTGNTLELSQSGNGLGFQLSQTGSGEAIRITQVKP